MNYNLHGYTYAIGNYAWVINEQLVPRSGICFSVDGIVNGQMTYHFTMDDNGLNEAYSQDQLYPTLSYAELRIQQLITPTPTITPSPTPNPTRTPAPTPSPSPTPSLSYVMPTNLLDTSTAIWTPVNGSVTILSNNSVKLASQTVTGSDMVSFSTQVSVQPNVMYQISFAYAQQLCRNMALIILVDQGTSNRYDVIQGVYQDSGTVTGQFYADYPATVTLIVNLYIDSNYNYPPPVGYAYVLSNLQLLNYNYSNSPTPSVTQTISSTPSVTPTLSVTQSITPSVGTSPTPTPTVTLTPSITPSTSSTPTISQNILTISGVSSNINAASIDIPTGANIGDLLILAMTNGNNNVAGQGIPTGFTTIYSGEYGSVSYKTMIDGDTNFATSNSTNYFYTLVSINSMTGSASIENNTINPYTGGSVTTIYNTPITPLTLNDLAIMIFMTSSQLLNSPAPSFNNLIPYNQNGVNGCGLAVSSTYPDTLDSFSGDSCGALGTVYSPAAPIMLMITSVSQN